MKFLLKIVSTFFPCAYLAANMNRIQAGTVTLWIYKTVDSLATAVTSAYFNNNSEAMRENDIVLLVSSSGGTNAIDVLVVTSADNATPVTVTNGT